MIFRVGVAQSAVCKENEIQRPFTLVKIVRDFSTNRFEKIYGENKSSEVTFAALWTEDMSGSSIFMILVFPVSKAFLNEI